MNTGTDEAPTWIIDVDRPGYPKKFATLHEANGELCSLLNQKCYEVAIMDPDGKCRLWRTIL